MSKYHNFNSGTQSMNALGPVAPVGIAPAKKPGEIAREQQYGAALREQIEARSMSNEARPGMGLTGTVSTSQQVTVAKNALRRQQRYRLSGGKSAY